MYEVKPIGFEHISESLSLPVQGCGFLSLGWNVYAASGGSAYQRIGIFKKGNQMRFGFVQVPDGKDANGFIQIGTQAFWPARNDQASLVLGFRYKPGNRVGRAGLPIGIRSTQMVSDTAAVPTTTIYTIPAGAPEAYYELVFIPYDGVAGYGCSVYRDGDLITTVGMNDPNSFTRALWRSVFLTFGVNNQTHASTTGVEQGDWLLSFEDMYAGWSTDRVDPAMRLGPIRTKRIPFLSVDPGSWSPQGGKTPLQILNLSGNGLNDRTDYMVNDPANTVLKAKLDPSVLKDSDKVIAVVGATSAWRDVGTVGTLATKWKNPSGESATVSYAPTTGVGTAQFDVQLPILTTAPGGAVLNKASLADLELVVTPTP